MIALWFSLPSQRATQGHLCLFTLFHQTKNGDFRISQAGTTWKSSEQEAVEILGPGPSGFGPRLGKPHKTWKVVSVFLGSWSEEGNILHPPPKFLIFGEGCHVFPCRLPFYSVAPTFPCSNGICSYLSGNSFAPLANHRVSLMLKNVLIVSKT